jgi:TetR/AcrR family transcriptional repressor of nem operon
MRKSKQETAETREKILSVAAAKFIVGGLEKTGVADIMHAAGLTHGGFYKHFESKEQLVSESVALAFERSHESLQQPKAKSSLQGMLDEYLSKGHRDDPSIACPLSSLGTELQGGDEALKAIATGGIDQLVAQVRTYLPDLSPKEARKRAHAVVAAMVGAMMLSRIVKDQTLSDSLLRDTKEFLLER